ncbi:hypothetical protein O3M35_011401 [Rhynocoris fuscipes]
MSYNHDSHYNKSLQWSSDYNQKNISTISKMQHQYWVTKETVLRKLGRNQDVNIVASDAELDAKLELFRSIQDSCFELQRTIDKYQERICILAQEENAMGRFLKESGRVDKTPVGSLMLNIGKTMSQSGQQRISLRSPLLRLFQEVETFRQRAIQDTLRTVQAMEKARTEYRASLSWMKDVSQELDPDTYKQMEKFRKVQETVKKSKAVFDRYKLDCLQKVDLLAAARCNMFSHALILYHNAMLQFATSSAQAYSEIANSCQDHSKFEFSVLKELSEMKPEDEASASPVPDKEDDKLLNFDDFDLGVKANETPSETKESAGIDLMVDSNSEEKSVNQFLPSQLLLSNQAALLLDSSSGPDVITGMNAEKSDAKEPADASATNSDNSKSKTSWLELFSELDPLSNPDSVGQTSTEPLRNC